MSKSKYRVAVIGLGNMGRHHVRNFSEMENADLVAVCDHKQSVADDFAQQYGAKAYTNEVDLIQNEDVDAISIITPTDTHFAVAKLAIENDIHVMVEKPITDNVEDAQALVDLANARGITLMVGHIEQFNPAVQRLKKAVDDGVLGDILSMSARRVSPSPPQIKDMDVLIDLAVHDIGVMNYLIGQTPTSVKGHLGRGILPKRDDLAVVMMTYPKAVGVVDVNWVTPIRIRTLSVTGTKGIAELDYIAKTVVVYPTETSTAPDENGRETITFSSTEAQHLDVPDEEPLRQELAHFLSCIETQTTPLVSGAVGTLALKLAIDARP